MAKFLFVQNKGAAVTGTTQWDIKFYIDFVNGRSDAIEFANKLVAKYPRFKRSEKHETTYLWVYLESRSVKPKANIQVYYNGNVVFVNVPGFNGELVLD